MDSQQPTTSTAFLNAKSVKRLTPKDKKKDNDKKKDKDKKKRMVFRVDRTSGEVVRLGGKKPRPKPPPLKKKGRSGAPTTNTDPYYPGHLTPKLDVHYERITEGVDVFRCKGPGLNPNHPHVNGKDVGSRSKVRAHAIFCWPNLLEKKKEIRRQSGARHTDTERRSNKRTQAKLKVEKEAADSSGRPLIPCTEQGCKKTFSTKYYLQIHIGNAHSGILEGVKALFSQAHWKGRPLKAGESGDSAALKKELVDYLDNKQESTSYHFVYIDVFLPYKVDNVAKAWAYLEGNEKYSNLRVPFYVGKATIRSRDFSSEQFHLERWPKSTVLDYARTSGKRAFELCVLPCSDGQHSAHQEAILQIIGDVSSGRDLRSDCINFEIINKRSELEVWKNLPEEDFDRALMAGLQRQPILTLEKVSGKTNRTSGEKRFGLLRRSEVCLIPFAPTATTTPGPSAP